MNQIFVGGIALIIAFILWSSKKQSKGVPFLRSQNNSLPINDATTSFVQNNQLINHKEVKNFKNLRSIPFSNRASFISIKTQKQLTKLISSNPDDRLLAIQIASQWENKKAIPFLRRGLKDFDSRVVVASAAAIASHKGKTIYLQKKPQACRPPRNVSLIR